MPKVLSELTGSAKNPRKISDEKLRQLGATMEKWGDLSGITWNRRLKRLTTGHQRTKKLAPQSKIVITSSYPEPEDDGTVARGYIEDAETGARWAYREVEWDEHDDLAANVAANASGGRFNNAMLAEVIVELDHADFPLEATGLTAGEIENIVAPDGGAGDETGDDGKRRVEFEAGGSTPTERKECPRCGYKV